MILRVAQRLMGQLPIPRPNGPGRLPVSRNIPVEGTRLALTVLLANHPAAAQTMSSQSAVSQPSSPTAAAWQKSYVACMLPDHLLDIACTLPGGKHEDPDIKSIVAGIATTEAQTLAYAQSTQLDSSHQIQTLGKLAFYDQTLSVNNNVACASCHVANAGWAGGSSLYNMTIVAQPGSVPITTGAQPDVRIKARKPESIAYATYAPPLQYNATVDDFYGGNTWDGKAS